MLKIAIVGTGIIAKSHTAAIEQLEKVTLTAVCDINEEKAKAYSEEFGVPYVLDYKELPEKADFDAVILNLPHGLHCEATEFFLNAGKHVLVEKPMANTVEECERMLACAKKNNKKLAIAHIQRFNANVKKVKEIYESGELGRLCMYTESRCENYFNDNRPKWFLTKKLSGGGIAMNFAAHSFDKLLSVMDGAKITSVNASCGNYTTDYDVEGHAQILAQFDNGVSASITLNGYGALGTEVNFYFTKGALKIARRALTINRLDGNGYVPLEITPGVYPFVDEIDAFYKYVNGEDSNIPDGEYSKQIIAAIKAAYNE